MRQVTRNFDVLDQERLDAQEARRIADMEAEWEEMVAMEQELRNGIVEDGVVCVVEGEVIEGTHVLIAAA